MKTVVNRPRSVACPQGRAPRMASGGGFTLVEMMIVAVFVAILASVAIALFSGNTETAMLTEAKAGLGTARSCLRTMYAVTRAYDRTLKGDTLEAGAPLTSIPGIGSGSLQGKFFRESDYTIQAISPNGYILRCEGSQGPAAGLVVTLDEAGNFSVYRTGNASGGSGGGSGGEDPGEGDPGEGGPGEEDPPRWNPEPPIKPPGPPVHPPRPPLPPVVPPVMPPEVM